MMNIQRLKLEHKGATVKDQNGKCELFRLMFIDILI